MLEGFVYCSGGCGARHAVNAFWRGSSWTCPQCERWAVVVRPLRDKQMSVETKGAQQHG